MPHVSDKVVRVGLLNVHTVTYGFLVKQSFFADIFKGRQNYIDTRYIFVLWTK